MQSTLEHAVQGDLAEKLKARLDNRTAKIGIMGLGYVGLPLALLFSEQKFPVTGFDIDKKKVDTLNTGGSYIYRITKEEIAAARSNGFTATADPSKISEMDTIIICVPTPLNEYREPDMTYIVDTAEIDRSASACRATGCSGKHHVSRNH